MDKLVAVPRDITSGLDRSSGLVPLIGTRFAVQSTRSALNSLFDLPWATHALSLLAWTYVGPLDRGESVNKSKSKPPIVYNFRAAINVGERPFARRDFVYVS